MGLATLIVTPQMRQAVKIAAGIGLPLKQIAKLVIDNETMRPIAVSTLEKRFKEELEAGLAEANHKVSSKLLELCEQGNVQAIMWWEKTRQGRYEKRDFRGMANNGELNLSAQHLSKLTNDQLHALEAVLRVVAAGVNAAGTGTPAGRRALPAPKLVEAK